MSKHAFLALTLLVSLVAGAQSDKYTQVMQKNIDQLDSAKSIDELQSLASTFDRIGDAEKTRWLPYYYAALAQTWVGWNPAMKDKDGNSAKINAYLAKAEAIEKNAELYAVENMSATQQMLVDPQSRWMTYGKTAGEALQKGLQADPNNPPTIYKGEGCDQCGKSGYKGRCGIHEILYVDEELEALIAREASIADLRDCARKSGFKNMADDGVLKVYEGLTTLESLMQSVNFANRM